MKEDNLKCCGNCRHLDFEADTGLTLCTYMSRISHTDADQLCIEWEWDCVTYKSRLK